MLLKHYHFQSVIEGGSVAGTLLLLGLLLRVGHLLVRLLLLDLKLLKGHATDLKLVSEVERFLVLDITGKASLLADVPWLQQSVDRRSPYIDVLNHVQIELLRRRRSGDNDDPLANRCLRLSIQAIAAGLRTTG